MNTILESHQSSCDWMYWLIWRGDKCLSIRAHMKARPVWNKNSGVPWHLLPAFPPTPSLLTLRWFEGSQTREKARAEVWMCADVDMFWGKTHQPYSKLCTALERVLLSFTFVPFHMHTTPWKKKKMFGIILNIIPEKNKVISLLFLLDPKVNCSNYHAVL